MDMNSPCRGSRSGRVSSVHDVVGYLLFYGFDLGKVKRTHARAYSLNLKCSSAKARERKRARIL